MYAWPAFLLILGIGLVVLQWGRLRAMAIFAETSLSGAVTLPCGLAELHQHLLRILTAEGLMISTRIRHNEATRIEADLYLLNVTRRNTGRVHTASITLHLKDKGASGSAFGWQIDTSQMANRFSGWCLMLRITAIGVMTILAAVMILFVLPSEDINIKVQVIQTIHIGHFLWPPFLIMNRYRFQLNAYEAHLINRFENLKHTVGAPS